MSYRVESIELRVRELPPDRMPFVIGKGRAATGPPPKRRPRAILLTRLQLRGPGGQTAWGTSGDRPSFGWLDKRGEFTPEEKLARLLQLVQLARITYLATPEFKSPVEHWALCDHRLRAGAAPLNHESLSVSYASAMIERAVTDAYCRLHQVSLFDALKSGRLEFPPRLLPEALRQVGLPKLLPDRPRTRFYIRHTVGLGDPLVAADIPSGERLDDGEPETLQEYVQRQGLRYFKIKISGDAERDLERLERIWRVVAAAREPVITLDGNESYRDLDAFTEFVNRFETRLLGMFQHTQFIEQPLSRAATHDESLAPMLRKLAARKPLVIDEADGTPDAFAHAYQLGYRGVSHKNCKGFYKSLVNYCRCRGHADGQSFQTGEDLSNMPLVPLHQDFAALGVLQIAHCERNGHHYSYGLAHLTAAEKRQTLARHGDLYVARGDEVFLRIDRGQVQCASLQQPGFGVAFAPDWDALTPLEHWRPQW